MSIQLGYCTNVHAGADFRQMKDNLTTHACAVKRAFSAKPMGLGLWFSARSAREALASARLPAFRDWLDGEGFVPFTLNGFPFGDFHQPTVKHDVYLPMWGDEERTRYTQDLISILDGILPSGMEGSISTLPVAWGNQSDPDKVLRQAASELTCLATGLSQLEETTGRRIVLCLEPEPGCLLDTSQDVIEFFERFLFQQVGNAVVSANQRYLQVCHDTCHASVMFEDQVEVFESYAAAGIGVGKVQVSSAIQIDFGRLRVEDRSEALLQLREFAEDRYLHQTGRKTGSTFALADDLPDLLDLADVESISDEEWRIHFHVPLHLSEFGHLRTTQEDTNQCLEYLKDKDLVSHFEVETYAWNVLPAAHRPENLADGIAQELRWTSQRLGID